MPTVTASVGLTIEQWQKCQLYKINRSAIARAAIDQEIERIEKETPANSRQTSAGAVTTSGGNNT